MIRILATDLLAVTGMGTVVYAALQVHLSMALLVSG